MEDPLAKRRQAYAAEVTRSAHSPRTEAAFAAVPREDYVAFPPWRVGPGVFGLNVTSDPARLYEDVLVAIDRERGINNGQPSLHALCIDALGQPCLPHGRVGISGGYASRALLLAP